MGVILIRWLKRAGLGLLSVVVLLVMSGTWLTWRSLPDLDGTVTLDGPEASVVVSRDHHGIPYISANSEGDAYFGLGYVHAQDRLFQMEFMRRLGAGRLAEVLGRPALSSDRFMRTLGLYRHAQANLDVLDPGARRVLERYADGVNAWLETRSGPLPPEFQLLLLTPEPWTPADSLVWQKLMSLSLAGNWRDELYRAKVARRLTPEQVAELWPQTEPNPVTTVAASSHALPVDVADTLLDLIDRYAPPALASNVWAIDGQHTETGKPLLASDPHLGFQAPIVWYLAHLSWDDEVRVGATTPGVPFPLIGHNGHVAWGITTTHADLQDLYVERVTPDGRYLTPNGPQDFDIRTETIPVRFADPVELTVRHTGHGPVVSDLAIFKQDDQDAGTVLALAATMLRDDERTATGMYRLGGAKTVDEARASLAFFEGPQQNFIYADVDGGIGFTAAAKVPMRKAGDGTVPVPGDTGAYDWQGWVPFDELPHSLRPASGRLVNANNRPMPEDYPHLIAASFPEGYRAQRVNERLDGLARGTATVGDMIGIQTDANSAMARDMLPLLMSLAQPKTAAGRQALALLSDWDGDMDRNRPEALLFLAWVDHVKKALFADDLGPDYQSFRGGHIRLIKSVLTERRHWCDYVTSIAMETCTFAVTKALDDTMAWLATRTELVGQDMAAWRWGQFHRARFAHPLFGLVPGLSSLTTVEIETDGSDHTVNRGGYRQTNGHLAFRHGHGAGLRAVFDLADLDRSKFIIAVGQSGHPASRWYDDLTSAWRDGGMLDMASSGPAERAHTLVLEPLSSGD